MPSIRERIAHRTTQNEIEYYEHRRWSERPDVSLEHALSRALFECQAVTLVISGIAPTLQVELTVFEEVESDPHRVRAQATLLLYDSGRAVAHRTITVEAPIGSASESDHPLLVAEAFSKALEGVVQQVSDQTVVALAELNTKAPASL